MPSQATLSSLGVLLLNKRFFCFIVSAHPPSGALQLLKAFEKQEEKPEQAGELNCPCAVRAKLVVNAHEGCQGSCKFGTAVAIQLFTNI